MNVIVTGGAGFIGSALIRMLVANRPDWNLLNIDKLTYAGNLQALDSVSSTSPKYSFKKIDICEKSAVVEVFNEFQPTGVIHLAAETHVDRSIDGPENFIKTNILGTFNLLEASRVYWSSLGSNKKSEFRFLHISTDEVFGSLGATGKFSESSMYKPNSPYSASKASSDHLVRAWFETYRLPILITNCSNNYGPYQFPEKLIPLMILNALDGKNLPVYGDGSNIRDWLFVDDHVRGLISVFEKGNLGETYAIGGNNEIRNIDIVNQLCGILDQLAPCSSGQTYARQIAFVKDRPGHDFR